jgi:hypothetical protein
MQLQLDQDELEILLQNLARHIQVLQDEVAHTESHRLQHELARELEALERVRMKLMLGAERAVMSSAID